MSNNIMRSGDVESDKPRGDSSTGEITRTKPKKDGRRDREDLKAKTEAEKRDSGWMEDEGRVKMIKSMIALIEGYERYDDDDFLIEGPWICCTRTDIPQCPDCRHCYILSGITLICIRGSLVIYYRVRGILPIFPRAKL